MTLQSELLAYLLSYFPDSGVREGPHFPGFDATKGDWDLVWNSTASREFHAAREAFVAAWDKCSAHQPTGDE